MRLPFNRLLTAVLLPLLWAVSSAEAQQRPAAADTIAIVRPVLDHLRPEFPRDSFFIDTHTAAGALVPLDTLAVSMGATVGAENTVIQCRRERPDACHMDARLLLRVDSILVRRDTADVFIHLWKPGASALLPIAQVERRFSVVRRRGTWRFARAARRVQVSQRLLEYTGASS